MIKALAHDEAGKPVVFLGITDRNVEKLTQGMPIHVDLRELGGEVEVRILIFHGKDEEALEKLMLKDGTSVGTIKRDKPLSLRDEFIEAVDGLLEQVGKVASSYQTSALISAVKKTKDALERMRD
jgi:hypothetical protein